MLCFGMFERRKFKSCSETNAEVNATGVVYTARSVLRGLIASAHFWVSYILTGVGIQTLLVLTGRLPTAETSGRADEDTPLFCML